MCGLGIWSDPTATGNTFDTSLKQGFRAVSGSRVSLASLTESAFRGLLQAVYTAAGSKGTFKLFAECPSRDKLKLLTTQDRPLQTVTLDFRSGC